MIPVRASVARWLEAEGPRSRALQLLARGWETASAQRVSRPLSVPASVRAVGIGGSTLGGSNKTPLAMALAQALAERGERVAFVGHAYRARPRTARIVSPADDIRDVGDEALLAARNLVPLDVDVVVGPTRQAAVELAARRASWLVLDGVLQARPDRLSRSLLCLDEHQPWGSGRCPPAGDLRAPREALLAATDAMVVIRDVEPLEGDALGDLRGTPFGLLLAIARPDRVLGSLAVRGLHPTAVIRLGDHDRPTAAELERQAARKQRVKVWLTTPKCALKLPPEVAGAPVLALDRRIELPKTLVDWVLSKGPLPSGFCSLGS
jgi:tetraacyldisaccharide 4'-kinase